MLKSDLLQTDKQSTRDFLKRENLRFLSRTNLNTNPLCAIRQNENTNNEKHFFISYRINIFNNIKCSKYRL